jgi:GxxExxY protein
MSFEPSTSRLLAADITHTVIGAFFSTYNDLGPGFPEFVARRALAIMIGEAGLAVREEIDLPVWFRGQRIAKFRADLVVADTLIVEVKASPEIDAFHTTQVLHYLKATDLEVGLLVNFGREPQFRRIVYENARKRRFFETPSQEEVAGNTLGDHPSSAVDRLSWQKVHVDPLCDKSQDRR